MIGHLLSEAKQLHELGRLDEARSLYKSAYEIESSNPELLYFYGMVLLQLKEYGLAEELYRSLVAIMPSDVDVNYHLALTLHAQSKKSEAKGYYIRAIEVDPSHHQSMNNLGELARSSGSYDDAIYWFEKALEVNSEYIEAAYNLMRVYLVLKKTDETERCVNVLENINQTHFCTQMGIGLLAVEKRQYEKAIRVFEKLSDKYPEDKGVLSSLVIAYRNSGQYQRSINLAKQFRERPDAVADDMLILANMELSTGDFEHGWSDYLMRFDDRKNIEKIRALTPDKLSNKSVLVQKEQGLGDELFFLRFLGALDQSTKKIAYSSESRLLPLIKDCPLFNGVIGVSEGNYDYTLRVADLGYIYSIGKNGEFPPPVRLHPKQDLVDKHLKKLGVGDGETYVGVTWRAGIKGGDKLFKSIPLSLIAEGIRDVDATIISLQRHPVVGEREKLEELIGKQILDYSHLNEDLEDMLALLSVLDDYIGVSNTNMHLRASLGMKASVLVPSPPEWRWFTQGDTSPWFPKFRLFRQESDGSWERAALELAKYHRV